MFPSIPRFVSGSTDGGIESKGPTTNPVTCVCVRVSVCLSVSVSVSVCLYACGVAQQRTIAGIARATAVCILCSLSLFQTRAHMHICSHTRSAPSNGMQMSKRKHN